MYSIMGLTAGQTGPSAGPPSELQTELQTQMELWKEPKVPAVGATRQPVPQQPGSRRPVPSGPARGPIVTRLAAAASSVVHTTGHRRAG